LPLDPRFRGDDKWGQAITVIASEAKQSSLSAMLRLGFATHRRRSQVVPEAAASRPSAGLLRYARNDGR